MHGRRAGGEPSEYGTPVYTGKLQYSDSLTGGHILIHLISHANAQTPVLELRLLCLK